MTAVAENVLRIFDISHCDYYLKTSYVKKVKSLNGFIQGVHFLSKSYSPAVDRFVARAATENIREEGRLVGERLRETLQLKSADYMYEEGEGYMVFTCSFCAYRLSASINKENLAQAIFTETLVPAEHFHEKADVIMDCLPHSQYDAHFTFKRALNPEYVISCVEESTGNEKSFSYEYSLDKTELRLSLQAQGIHIILNNNEARIIFSNKRQLSQYLGAL